MRYLGPNNPFVARVRGVHELRLADAGRLGSRRSVSSPTSLSCQSDLCTTSTWAPSKATCSVGNTSSRDFSTSSPSSQMAPYRRILCGMRIDIEDVCPVRELYVGSLSLAWEAIVRESDRV